MDQEQLQSTVLAIFNNLLDRPTLTPILMERVHRALKPKGKDTDPPRDVICCIVDFQLKEEILRKARNKIQITHNGSDIKIYQDLSAITLQHRRDLKPLLEVLRSNGIHYRWKFPFCLFASHQGRSAYLRVPEDLPQFCQIMGIPLINVPNWYAEFRPHRKKLLPPNEEPMEAQDIRYRRQRSPSETRPPQALPLMHATNSPTRAPQSRRARKEY